MPDSRGDRGRRHDRARGSADGASTGWKLLGHVALGANDELPNASLQSPGAREGLEERAVEMRYPGKGRSSLWNVARRAGLAAALLVAAPGHGFAQDSDWLPFNKKATKAAQEESRRQAEALNDLRPGNLPLRSDAIIEATERAAQRYEEIVAAGGWPMIPGTRSIRLEDDDERLPLLRRRLAATGELKQKTASLIGDFVGAVDLEAAVRRYQQNNGLRVTGRPDKYTIESMNVPAQARLAQLRLNVQRLRDLMHQRVEDRYILVNAAAYQLEAVERFEVEQRHRVIVGKPDRQTPIVKAQVRALNFFPY